MTQGAGIPEPHPTWIPSPKWVRVMFGGEIIADSKRAMLRLEAGKPPVYFFPQDDVRKERLSPAENPTSPPGGGANRWTVAVGDKVAEDAAWAYPNPEPGAPEFAGYIAFAWHKMDAWFEEDEEVSVHPRDPFKRVDVARSSRHVRIVVNGTDIAESTRPTLLFETGLRTRYYLPKLDVRMDLLLPSERVSHCPYKGEAHYYSAHVQGQVAQDVAWYYPTPTPGVAPIANLISFYDEHVEAVYVDGERQPKLMPQ